MVSSVVFSTVLAGTLVFVLGQIVLKFFIEPLQEYRGTRGEVSYALSFYANVAGDEQPEVVDGARKHLRRLAGGLRASLHKIPWYGLFAALGGVPKRGDLLEASSELIGWSNNLRDEWEGTTDRRTAIARRLGISEMRQQVGAW